ncbi:MAG: hypothetical protein K0Q87_2429 [Neobacillus sp.]|jgi:hypothetical protein|nr:hypothetical protein [Neobacillus sp.]
MNLIEVYIDEVTRRLPEKSRKDIALELRSTIEDMLPDEYTEEEIKQVLAQLGNPAVLASGYRDQPMHLIGPRYFDIYVNLLKLIIPIAAVVSLISVMAHNFIDNNGNETLLMIFINSIGIGIWGIISTGIQVFFWLTLVFAILERVDTGKSQLPLTPSLKEWTPDDLKDIPYIPQKKAISKFDVFGGLLWTAIWATVYFNAAHLAGVYEKGENGLEFVIPTFNQEVLQSYWPLVVLVIGLEIAVALYKWFASQWTMKVAFLNTTWQLVASIVFIVIFRDPDLFNTVFIDYMYDLFSIKNDLSNQIIGSAIVIVVVFAAIDIIQGFRKAKI